MIDTTSTNRTATVNRITSWLGLDRVLVYILVLAISGLVAFAATPSRAQSLGLGNQEMPSYAPMPYSPTFPGYHPTPVIGGYAPDPMLQYEPPAPAYQVPAYPQYMPSCRDPLTGAAVPCP